MRNAILLLACDIRRNSRIRRRIRSSGRIVRRNSRSSPTPSPFPSLLSSPISHLYSYCLLYIFNNSSCNISITFIFIVILTFIFTKLNIPMKEDCFTYYDEQGVLCYFVGTFAQYRKMLRDLHN